ncbi:hypothetical protein [Streptomyces sp. NPDC085540]|uniref:hypothetical protein n=1 Tax=Streptomyces sp. NPDC085540 TaxID=3365730 RepID=UPI0037CCCD01
MIDPLWYVYVHEGDGFLERRWAVGFFNGDAPANSLREAVWTGPDTIRMTAGDGTVHTVAGSPPAAGPTDSSPSGDGGPVTPGGGGDTDGDAGVPVRPDRWSTGQEDVVSFEKPRRVRSGTRSSAATAAAPSVTVS